MISTVRLRASDRAALERHFVALDRDDRRLRFGASIADEGIAAYLERIDFERDGLFAVHDDTLALIAVVHVAMAGAAAELGLSVLAGRRGQGLGDALLKRAVTFLRNRGVLSVYVHCLAENAAMMRLARRNGMRIVYAGGESDGRLELEPATAESYVSEWIDEQRGQAVRTIRQNARLAQTFMRYASGGLEP